jgi:hypothetical protein
MKPNDGLGYDEQGLPRLVFVEGYTHPNPEADLAPDGLHAPFWVFDSGLQDYPVGPFYNLSAAESAADAYRAQLLFLIDVGKA